MALVDAEQMHRSNPDTFEIPPKAERHSLNIGDSAKVCFDNKERMWVQVVAMRLPRRNKAEPPRYAGKLDNIPIVVDMTVGQRVEFEPRHIYQIQRRQPSQSS